MINIAIIGAGELGSRHLQALAHLEALLRPLQKEQNACHKKVQASQDKLSQLETNITRDRKSVV